MMLSIAIRSYAPVGINLRSFSSRQSNCLALVSRSCVAQTIQSNSLNPRRTIERWFSNTSRKDGPFSRGKSVDNSRQANRVQLIPAKSQRKTFELQSFLEGPDRRPMAERDARLLARLWRYYQSFPQSTLLLHQSQDPFAYGTDENYSQIPQVDKSGVDLNAAIMLMNALVEHANSHGLLGLKPPPLDLFNGLGFCDTVNRSNVIGQALSGWLPYEIWVPLSKAIVRKVLFPLLAWSLGFIACLLKLMESV